METIMLEKISDYVDHHAGRIPEKEALVLDQKRHTYGDLKSLVDRCALALLDAGITKGDRVATLNTPHPDFFVTFLAATSIGAIWIGLNPRYRLEEYRYAIGNAEPRLLFSRSLIGDRNFSDDLNTLFEEFDCLQTLVILDGDPPGAIGISFCDFIAEIPDKGEQSKLQAARGQVRGIDPALIVYTSGTTGKPKGAVISHHGLVRVAHVQREYWDISPIRSLNFLPINHIGCVGDIACYTYVDGGTIVFMEQFDPAGYLELIEREEITFIGAVPTAYQLCLSLPDFASYDLSSVQLIIWGGAKAPNDLIRKLADICPHLSTSYGQTESVGSVTFVRPCNDTELLSVSVGQPVPEYEFRIVDESGKPVEQGETGEIQVRGDFIMQGYWQNPEATAEAFEDNWLKTGDLARQNEDGHIQLVGRLKEMFISGGYNVFPLEIEQLLESHSSVAMAAVVSAPDELFSEIGHAWILREPGIEVTAEEILEFCKERLANYKVPKKIYIQEDLPTLPIGKLDRRALKERSLRMVREGSETH